MATRQTTWQPAARGGRGANVGQVERWLSAVAGAALVTTAIRRHNRQAWLLGALGSALLYRASTGACPVYSAAGINTADSSDTRRALGGARGAHAEAEVTIARPIEEVYAFWRRFDNLPRVMSHLESVTMLDDRRSRWVARAPMGSTVEWEAEINNEVPAKVIGWRSLEGSDVVSAGSVNFDTLPDGDTRVRVKLQYEPPAGRLGAWVAWLLGEEPSIQIRDDLQRFKQLMETGEFPSNS
jgi:uncharacterized membrane protein